MTFVRRGREISRPFLISMSWMKKLLIKHTPTLIFVWKWKLSRRTFIDVVSTLAKQRHNYVDKITLIRRQWTDVVSTLKRGWKWKFSQRTFIDVVSSLTKQRWTMSIKLHRFNVDKPTLFQPWNLVENKSWADDSLSKLFQHLKNNVETTLKQLRQFNVDYPILFQRWYLAEDESWVNVC